MIPAWRLPFGLVSWVHLRHRRLLVTSVLAESFKMGHRGFTGYPVKSPSTNAGDMSSIPGLGRAHKPLGNQGMPHNYWAFLLQVLKPVHLGPVLLSKRSLHSERPKNPSEKQPMLIAVRESPYTAMETQHGQKWTNGWKRKKWDIESTDCKAKINKLSFI